MFDIGSVLEIAAYTILLVLPTVVLVRFLAGGERVALADLFAIPIDPAWPRGVQEEEPVHWRVEVYTRGSVTARQTRALRPN